MMDVTHKGGCHCGAVTFLVKAPEVIDAITCNCSICSMTGFSHLIVKKDAFTLLSGEEHLTTYKFNTKTAKHLFCAKCGVKSFYVPRSHPDGYSVNVQCLDKKTIKGIVSKNFDGAHWEDHIIEIS